MHLYTSTGVRTTPDGRVHTLTKCLPVGPLASYVEVRGGIGQFAKENGPPRDRALRRQYARAVRDGYVTEQAADQLATLLVGMPPELLWGAAYDDAWKLLLGEPVELVGPTPQEVAA